MREEGLGVSVTLWEEIEVSDTLWEELDMREEGLEQTCQPSATHTCKILGKNP